MTSPADPFPADPITNTIFWIDPDGRILDASDGVCRALGYVRDEAMYQAEQSGRNTYHLYTETGPPITASPDAEHSPATG